MYKISSISIFSLFSFLQYNFIIYINFTHIAASNTATGDVTNYVIHRIFHTNIQYSCAHFTIKSGEKSSLVDDF